MRSLVGPLAAALVLLAAAPAWAEPVSPAPVVQDGRVASWDGGVLGEPLTDVRQLRGGGSYQQFEDGAVYSSPVGGTHAVALDFQEAWGRSGWENGPLGYPVADEFELRFVAYLLFHGGCIDTQPGAGCH